MIVRDGHVRGGRAMAGLDGDVVVAGVDETVSDGDVSRVAGIDAIGVARVLRRIDNDAPGGKSVSVGVRNMEVGRVTQGDAVEGEIVGVRKNQDARAVLILVFDLGFLREVPPGNVLAGEFLAAAAIDCAIAHHAGVGHVDAGDDRLAPVAGLIDDAAAAGGDVIIARVAAGVERGVGVDEQSYSGAQLERAGEEGCRSASDLSSTAWPAAQWSSAYWMRGGIGMGVVGACGVSGERDAGGRDDWLGDGAGILRVGGAAASSREARALAR